MSFMTLSVCSFILSSCLYTISQFKIDLCIERDREKNKKEESNLYIKREKREKREVLLLKQA